MDGLIERAKDIYIREHGLAKGNRKIELRLIGRAEETKDYIFNVSGNKLLNGGTSIWTLERSSLAFLSDKYITFGETFLSTRLITRLVFLYTSHKLLKKDIGEIQYHSDYWIIQAHPDSLRYVGEFKLFKTED